MRHERVRRQDAEAVVDVAACPAAVPLVVVDDRAVLETARCSGPSGRRCGRRSSAPAVPLASKCAFDGGEVASAGTSRRTARRTRRPAAAAPAAARRRCRAARAVEANSDIACRAATVADHGLDLLAEMAHAEHDAVDALLAQLVELVHDERLARDVDQRLGDRLGDRAQPSGQAAGQNRDRQASARTPPSCPRSRSGSALPRARPRPSRGAAGCDPRRRTSGSRRRRRRSACRRPRRSAWPSSYHSSICGLLMPPERCFLCSQCSCISSPKSRGLPASSASLAAQPELLDVVQVVEHLRVALLRARCSGP